MNLFARALFLLFALAFGAASAEAQTRVAIKSDRTNVRAKPALDGEILASLNKGQEVVVLGEVTPPKSRETWSRIAMPSAVTVWVYGQLVDLKNGTVRAKELNYRAGPGRNYSVLGELKRGDSIKVIREFDGWVQIEPPAHAEAYIASRLLSEEPAEKALTTPVSTPANVTTPPRVAAEPTSAPAEIKPAPTPPPVTPTSAPTTTPAQVLSETPAPPATESPVVSQTVAETPAALDSTTFSPARTLPIGSPRARNDLPPAPSSNVLLTDVPGRPVVVDAEPRFVVREGNVLPTVSIQAPTDYELRNGFYQEGALNYLLFEPQKVLRQFSGKRVMVSGYEYHDSRWRLPVLKVDKIQLVQ